MLFPVLEEPGVLFQTCITFIIAVQVLHTWLDWRQLQAIRLPSPPAILGPASPTPEKFEKTQAYCLDKWWFSFWHQLSSLAQSVGALYFGALPWLWEAAGGTVDAIRLPQGEVAQACVFALLLDALSTITELPWSVYSTFVLEQRHGFNRQTPSLFVADQVKSTLLSLVLLPLVVAPLTLILLRAGPWVPFILWLFILGLSLLAMTVYPVLIAPLFNRFETLPEGPLRSSIEGLAGSLNFPLKKLFKMDGSKRSGHSNAYMYGFFKNKRIVLYDTLIEQCEEEQVVAVLAHELGHWKLGHTPRLFLATQLITLTHFSLFSLIRNSGPLYAAFGFVNSQPAFIALVLYQLLSAPLDEVVGVASNVVSRTFEFQADAFAVSLGHGKDLRVALLRLQEENKSSPNVDPLYSAYHYSHPPLVERLKAIDIGITGKDVLEGGKKVI